MNIIYLCIFLIGIIILGVYFIRTKILVKKKSIKKEPINIKNEKNKIELIFYWAEWCTICKRIKPVWNDTKLFLKDKYPNIEIREIECDDPDKCYILENNKKKIIDGVPTIILRGIGNDIEYKSDKSNNILCNKTKEDIDKFLNLYLILK